MNAHADMLIVVKYNEKYIPRGIYRFLALGYETLQDFNAPKQALINAFYYVFERFLLGWRADIPAHIPQRESFRLQR